MKKVSLLKRVAVIVIALVSMSVTAQAQDKGDIAVGVNAVLGSGESYTNFGIGAKLQYNIIKPIRLEGAFNYYPEKDLFSLWDLGLNVHYLIPVGEKLVFYPLAGVGVLGFKANIPTVDLGELGSVGGGSVSDSQVAYNVGAGVDFKLTEKLFLNLEAKYKISDGWNRFLVSAGAGFRF
jgi:outer membrane protein X